MPQKHSNYELYLNEPRFRMTFAGRLLVRIVIAVAYVVFAIATFAFLFSGIHFVVWLGIFMVLFLIDLLAHHGQGDVPISELDPKGGKINLAGVMSPAAFNAIERVLDRSNTSREVCADKGYVDSEREQRLRAQVRFRTRVRIRPRD